MLAAQRTRYPQVGTEQLHFWAKSCSWNKGCAKFSKKKPKQKPLENEVIKLAKNLCPVAQTKWIIKKEFCWRWQYGKNLPILWDHMIINLRISVHKIHVFKRWHFAANITSNLNFNFNIHSSLKFILSLMLSPISYSSIQLIIKYNYDFEMKLIFCRNYDHIFIWVIQLWMIIHPVLCYLKESTYV